MEMFTCPRHAGSLRLSVAGCATMWEKAARVSAEHPLHLCKGCEVGAECVKGVAPTEAALSSSAEQRREIRVCCRCLRPASRYVLEGRICVSCYNRQREQLVGRDARGKRPRTRLKLSTMQVLYRDRGGDIHRAVLRQVASADEALLAMRQVWGARDAWMTPMLGRRIPIRRRPTVDCAEQIEIAL